MRIPARALKPLVAMAIAAASFGCIAPAAYAENATAAVISDDGGHVVVDVDVPARARRLAGFQRDAAQGGGRVLARRPRRPAEALRHFRIPAGARRPGNRADMGDAEAEELMRDRCRFSRIDHRHICPDAYPHIGIHTPRHIRAHAYIHTSTIAHMRAGIRHRRTDEQAATPYEIAACSRTEVPPMKEIRDARMGKTSRSASRDPHHSEAIVPVCASGYTGARGNARKHIRPAFQNFL